MHPKSDLTWSRGAAVNGLIPCSDCRGGPGTLSPFSAMGAVPPSDGSRERELLNTACVLSSVIFESCSELPAII